MANESNGFKLFKYEQFKMFLKFSEISNILEPSLYNTNTFYEGINYITKAAQSSSVNQQNTYKISQSLYLLKNFKITVFSKIKNDWSNLSEQQKDTYEKKASAILSALGYKLYKYERFKELLEDNKNLNKLFIPDSYKPENFSRGINYINMELLFPRWIHVDKKDKETEEKKPRKRLSEHEKKVKEKKFYKIRKKLKENIPIKLRLDYRQFKKTELKKIKDEWINLSEGKKEPYINNAERLLKKKREKIDRRVKRWNKFKQEADNVFSERTSLADANRKTRNEVKELKKLPENKAQIKNKRNILKEVRKNSQILHQKISQYRNTFQEEFIKSFKNFPSQIQKEIQALALKFEIEIQEDKDEKTKDKWEEEYKNTQILIQETISKQQDLINKSKTKLSSIFQQIREKYTEYITLMEQKEGKGGAYTEMEKRMKNEPQTTSKDVKISYTQYKRLRRDKEELVKQISIKLKAIEKKTGLDSLKKVFERKLATYDEKDEKATEIVNKINKNKEQLNTLLQKLKTIRVEIQKVKKILSTYETPPLHFNQRLESLKQAQNFTKDKIVKLEKMIIQDRKSPEYNYYLFKKSSDSFKWIQKINVLYNVYIKQLDILKSIKNIKPTYIKFDKEEFRLKKPTDKDIPTVSIKSVNNLYKKLYESKNIFLKNLTGYLPNDYITLPVECRKVLVKVGAHMLLNNNSIPITNTNCTFLYINENKTKTVNGKLYYQIVNKNLKFVEKGELLTQCSVDCPKKSCKDYMPFSKKEFKCIKGACVDYKSNNDNPNYTKLVKNYRKSVLNILISLFGKVLKVDYPLHTIYASNVEKYYYINSINFLSYIFNCSMIFSIFSIKYHPDCNNHIIELFKNILTNNDYKYLPLNFKAILKYLCSEDYYTTPKHFQKMSKRKSLIGLLFLKQFRKSLNSQLNEIYSNYALTAKKFFPPETELVISAPFWQNILITFNYAPTDYQIKSDQIRSDQINFKLSVYKNFLKTIYTLIEFDLKKLNTKITTAKTKLKKKNRTRDKVEFENSFIGQIDLKKKIMHQIYANNFNPYFYNLLQLTITNFNLYYETIADARSVTSLFTQLQSSLHNTLTEKPAHKNKMEKIKVKVQYELTNKKTQTDAPPQTISDVVFSQEKLKTPVLWSRKSCNPLLAQLDSLIQEDQIKARSHPPPPPPPPPPQSSQKNLPPPPPPPPVGEAMNELQKQQPVSEPESSTALKIEPEIKKDVVNFKSEEKCFQCQNEIKNKNLRTVHLPTNKEISFCGFKCFTKYDH